MNMFEKPPESNITTQNIEKTSEQMLEEIQKAKPQVEWVTYVPDKQYGTTISLPFGCHISGSLNYLNNERTQAQMYIDMFKVNEQIQRGGIGTRLLQSLAVEGKKYGATELYGHVTSESVLKTRAKVFGKENLRFFNHYTKKPVGINYEEALKNSSDGRVDFDVEVDLTAIDTSNWEGPEEHEK